MFMLKQNGGKRIEFNTATHLAFLDLEEAFDTLHRATLWDNAEKRIPYSFNKGY